MSSFKPANRSKTWQKSQLAESKLIKREDQIAAFEEFHTKLLPQLREAIASGKGAKEIFEEWAPLAAARIVNIAATEMDSAKALAAAEKIIHQALGKPTERKELTHKMESLSEEQLDALLMSRMKEIEAIEVEDVTDEPRDAGTDDPASGSQ